MRRSLKLLALASLTTLGTLSAAGAASTSDVEMLRELFRHPRREWKIRLTAELPLLTEDFFSKVDQRIDWSVEHDNAKDAIDFALVGDLGAQITQRNTRFRLDLAEQYLGAKDYDDALAALDSMTPENASDAELDQALTLQSQINRERNSPTKG